MNWNWELILAGVVAIFGAGYLGRLMEKRFPSKRERRKDDIAWATDFAQGQQIIRELTDHLDQKVKEKTGELNEELQKFREMWADREIEHREQIDVYVEKALEIKKKLEEEISLRMDCLSRLNKAENELIDAKRRISELESKLK